MGLRDLFNHGKKPGEENEAERMANERLRKEAEGERPICSECGKPVPMSLGRPDYHILFGKVFCHSCAQRLMRR